MSKCMMSVSFEMVYMLTSQKLMFCVCLWDLRSPVAQVWWQNILLRNLSFLQEKGKKKYLSFLDAGKIRWKNVFKKNVLTEKYEVRTNFPVIVLVVIFSSLHLFVRKKMYFLLSVQFSLKVGSTEKINGTFCIARTRFQWTVFINFCICLCFCKCGK